MSLDALKKLVTSSKASVLMAIVIVLLVLMKLGDITAAEFLAAIKVLVPSWMISHAAERGAKAIADGKTPPATAAPDLDPPED